MKKGNQYKKGANKERQWVKYLKAKGAFLATRTPGSHSPIDVIALFPMFTYVAQLKAGATYDKKDLAAFRKMVMEDSPIRTETVYEFVFLPDREAPIIWTWLGQKVIREMSKLQNSQYKMFKNV